MAGVCEDDDDPSYFMKAGTLLYYLNNLSVISAPLTV
jgi:hypothetical protein